MMDIIQALQSLAQTGLAYAKDPYDRQRFDSVRQIAVRLLQEARGIPQAQAEALILDDEGYRTPKVDVRGAVFQGERVLLVKEKADELWCLPGGWADLHETPAQAVEREVFEESGLETRAIKLAAVHDTEHHGPKQFYQAYKLLFLCELVRGEFRCMEEISALAFFPREALPPLSTRRTTAEQIHLLFDHWQNRNRPTDFD